MRSSPPFRLRLFGSPSLAAEDGTVLSGRPMQRHRLALLALLARSPQAEVTRDVLMAYLWPESDVDRARNLLNVAVYVLRQALGEQAIVSSANALRLATDVVDVDVVTFESALGRGDREVAAEAYRGPFLEGFFLPDSPEFAHWVDRERARLSDKYAHALESLAEEAELRGDLSAAAERWKALSAHDPYDSRVALRLMAALAASGSLGGAFRHAEMHERLLRDELGIEPPTHVAELVALLRQDPPDGWMENEGRGAAAVLRGATWNRLAPEPSPSSDLSDSAPPGFTAAPVGRAYAWRAPRSWIVLSLVPLVTAVVILARELVGRGGTPEGTTAAARSGALPTMNPAAWELYRRASQQEVLRSDAGAREALALLQRAVELDPGFAGAHAGLARLHLRVAPPGEPRMALRDRLALARRHAIRATELDPSSAESHGVKGLAEMFLYDFDAAEADLLRALELEPRNARIREWLVGLHIREGRYGQALEEAERSLKDDPLSPTARAEVAHALLANGRCDDALRQLEALADLTPPLLRTGSIAAQCHAMEGSWTEALAAVSSSVGRSERAKAAHAYYLGRSGRSVEATEALEELLAIAARTGEDAFSVATVLAGLGRTDEAFVWLGRSVEDYSFTSDIAEPVVADLKGDPRFAQLMERAGLMRSHAPLGNRR